MSQTCRVCNSERIIPNIKMLERGNGDRRLRQKIEISKTPRNLIFKNRVFCHTVVDICADCGLLETRVENPGKLWNAYQKQLENS